MGKISRLEKCSTNELLSEIKKNNNHISKINKILENYDVWLEKFENDFNLFKQSCQNLSSFVKSNIETVSKNTREMSDMFFSREVFNIVFKKPNHKEMYFQELKETIKLLMKLKDSNRVFHDYLIVRAPKNAMAVYIGEYFFPTSDLNSDKLMWEIRYHEPMNIDPVKQGKEMDLCRFEEEIVKIIEKEHEPFTIINIPKKNYYKEEIEIFNKNNRQIELIIRARKKGKEKMENVGYVYVLSNEAYPNIYKIGSTYGLPEERAEELTGTGHLTSFKVVGKIKAQSAEYYEKSIHELLKDYRVKEGREFFKLDLKKIKDCLKQVSEISEKGTKKITLAKMKKEINLNK